jgi:predicted protein tyrosine phosphatase
MPVRAASVHVCSLRHVPTVIERTGARRLVSAINAELLPDTPPTIAPEHHLKLDMHDITEASLGATAPAARHVTELLDFVQSWNQEAPLLIHCFAGLSRSTAAAYITLCALNPETPEEIVARALRRSSDTAVPNRLFVALADRTLRRQGRMVSALECMGPNRVVIEGSPFAVAARHDDDDANGVVTLAAAGRRAGR